MLKSTRRTARLLAFWGQGRVEAGSSLLDEGEMKPRSIGNGLEMIGNGSVEIQREIVIVAGEWPGAAPWQGRDGEFERAAQVGIGRGTPVAGPESSVNSDLFEVGQPAGLWDAK